MGWFTSEALRAFSLLFLLAAPLVAAEPRVGITVFELKGKLEPAAADLLADTVEQAAVRTSRGRGFDVHPERLKVEPGCHSRECLFSKARAWKVHALVTGRLVQVDGEWAATLRLLSVADGKVLGSKVVQGRTVGLLVQKLDAELEPLLAAVEQLAPQLDRACHANDAMGCAILGQSYDQGRGVTQDTERAKRLLTQACDGGVGSACAYAAAIWTRVPFPRFRQAGDLHLKGCSLEYGKSCWQVGQYYETGYAFLRQDVAAAARFYARACELGDTDGCVDRDRLVREQQRPVFHITR